MHSLNCRSEWSYSATNVMAGAAIFSSDPTCKAIFPRKSPSEKCLFAQKLGPNLSKMEVRTFVSIKKVIRTRCWVLVL